MPIDMAAALRLQLFPRCMGEVEHPAEPDIELAVPLLRRRVVEGDQRHVDPVVDNAVQPAPTIDNIRYKLLAPFEIGGVGDDSHELRPIGFEIRRSQGQFLLVDVGNTCLPAGPPKGQSDAPTEAAATTGHESDSILLFHHIHPFFTTILAVPSSAAGSNSPVRSPARR